MIKNNEKAAKILDYWFALEFLAQDKYPDYWETRNRVKKHKDMLVEGKSQYKTIENFIPLTKDDVERNLYDIIFAEAKSCQMKRWGNITVYIGKVKRERCIERIASILPFDPEEENRPEKSVDKIAWLSLQLSPEGNYIENTLSLSTILWALNVLKQSKGNISGALDNKCYNECVKELEKKFFDKDDMPKQKEKDQRELENLRDEIQLFDASAVSLKKLHDLFDEIEKEYICGNIENTDLEKDAYEEVYGISFQLFEDEETKNKREEDNYLGLDHDYFSNDLKMVLELAKNNKLESDIFLGKDLQKYITTKLEEKTENRFDVIQPEEGKIEEYKERISKVLNIGNAPIGKWPSRFMPVLMQQMAINSAIGRSTGQESDVNGKIFSVNGPPGTGKTTLLKEIVVNNIIERAQILAKYDNPDDAFIQCDFLHGSKEENGYSSFVRHWYRLKDDEINNYSILVTSCNNTAVENISKELPKGVLKDLKPLKDDSEEMKNLLNEVTKMFDSSKSGVFETTYQGETYADLYFTRYAQEMIESDDVWGLVAAPLGKKSNIKDFYNKVLYPLSRDFYKNKDVIQERLPQYKKAREAFLEQVNKVKDIRRELEEAGILLQKLSLADKKSTLAKENLYEASNDYLVINEESEKKKEEILACLNEIEKRKESCSIALEQIQVELQLKRTEAQQQHDLIKKTLLQELKTRDSVGGLSKIFKSAKYQAALKLADEYKKDAEKLQQSEQELDYLILGIEKNRDHASEVLSGVENEEKEMNERIISLNKKINSAVLNKANAEKENSRAEKNYMTSKKDVETYLKIQKEALDIDQMVIINDEYISALLSDDIDIVTKAQVDNPWFTQRYNREREKLFALAMQMNKEFVVSAKKCRDNFSTIAHYWGLKTGDDNERVIFHKEDKERMVSALYQTLFLLVPVISSTFASVGTLFKDVKESGMLGMLIVDEAGQAQPQMAVGALYRSRKAIIVGDPKQVQPVVTDDLLLLKKAYNDDLLKLYKEKNLSVQSFADLMNNFGTYLDNGTDYPEWVGCPLLVHRRCISPMYEISNQLSYNNIMKQQTNLPKQEVSESFIYENSKWINVIGKEIGNKNHFVEAQAEKVCELLEKAFSNDTKPNIYIISPFTTVVSGIKEYIKKYCKKNKDTKINEEYLLDYDQKKIGTVHTFQGKEANEVIFLLGCDVSKEAEGAINWVNKNIINVAVTRAKYRLYVIGDEDAWLKSSCVREAKQIMDTFAIKEIKTIIERELPEEEERKALLDISASLPAVTQFHAVKIEDEKGVIDYSVDTSGLIHGLNEEFINTKLSNEQLKIFGFESEEDLNGLSQKVRENLELGMKLFFLLEPVYKVNNQMDASCCAILFCKAIELQMKDCFTVGLKKALPDFKVKGNGKGREKIALKDVHNKELTLGTFDLIIRNNEEVLSRRMSMTGNPSYNIDWWKLFEERLNDCTVRRNKCCHSGLFSWKELSYLLYDMFMKHKTKDIYGLMSESLIGKKM